MSMEPKIVESFWFFGGQKDIVSVEGVQSPRRGNGLVYKIFLAFFFLPPLCPIEVKPVTEKRWA